MKSLDYMKKSALVKETLGENVFHKFIDNKHWEIEEYNKNVSQEYDKKVSDYEIEKYLPVL